MGKLFDEILKEKSTAGNKSRIQEICDSLSAQDKEDFIKALDDHGIPASNISKAMTKRGYKLSSNVISRYRRGELVAKINEPS